MSTGVEELSPEVTVDRRRFARRRIDLECQVVTDDFFLLGDVIVEASAAGFLLRARDIPARVGETVTVAFRPPRSNEWIDAEATIVRLVTGTQPGAPAFGLELNRLSPFDHERLARSLEESAANGPEL